MQIHFHKRLLLIFIGLVLVFTFYGTTAIAVEEISQPNVRVHRTARISDGMIQQAFQFAKEITEYVNTKYPQVSVQVYVEAFGAVGTIHWFVDYKDLATLERTTGQLFSDQGYLAILGKAPGLFIEGSVHDTLLMLMR